MDTRKPTSRRQGTQWHSLSTAEAVTRLETTLTAGLSSEEAAARLAQYGRNELEEAPGITFWQRLRAQLSDFLVLILLAASLVSLLLGDYIEAAAIMAIVVLNAALGVIQESRAEEALAALRKMSAPGARVVRDGRLQTLPAGNLVPGDIVVLEAGNYVPADMRLVEAVNLKIDESSLTGESLPVDKYADPILDPEASLGDRSNSAFMSTLISYGRGRGLVVGTGMRTEIGLIAGMIQSFETEPTPLQKKLDQLGRTLGVAALGLCGLVFLIGVVRFLLNPPPDVTLTVAILDLFIVAVSLAIAAVPEGLPAVVTISLALGMQRMIQRHALIRRLPAVEALGSATAICSDKTGTLTQNAMTVVQLWSDEALLTVSGEGYQPRGDFWEGEGRVEATAYRGVNLLLQGLLLCNDADLQEVTEDGVRSWRIIGDPTEGALVVAAAKAGFRRADLNRSLPRVAEIPFDSERKRMTTIHEDLGSVVADFGLETTLWRDRWSIGAVTVNPADPLALAAGARSHARFAGSYFGADGAGRPSPTPDPHAQAPASRFLAFVKGAPDVVLGLCTRLYGDRHIVPMSPGDRLRILDVNAGLSANALRVLAAAVKVLPSLPEGQPLDPEAIESDLIFVGLVGMIDPARPEVKPAIAQARQAGIKTVMITGDYPNTAAAIAREIGLMGHEGEVLTGRQLDGLGDEAFDEQVDAVSVYARVSPEHKVRIVEALRRRGHIVAMTGDGVNDAPALKRADIGVAMGITGTDVSKETAAMVLTDDNYASIVSAVEEGRTIYANIRKFVYYLLSCNVGEVLAILVATLLGWPLPLTALQLLVMNLVTDGAPALALGLEPGERDTMQKPPRQPDEPVIDQWMVQGIVVQAVAITVAVLVAFQLGLRLGNGNLVHAQTMAFATLSVSQLLRAYTARSEYFNVWQIPLLGNRAMQLSILGSLIVVLIIIYIPALDVVFHTTYLTLNDWGLLLPLILLPSVAEELRKVVQRRLQPRPL